MTTNPNHKDLSFKEDISWLMDTHDPESVLTEVKTVVFMFMPDFDFTDVQKVFDDTVSLFKGTYSGYKPCSTEYHDLKHTTDVFMAMACLFHGYSLAGIKLSPDSVRLGLIGALLHDAGYIQRESENHGTGAKFTAVHVERSIEFMDEYFKAAGWEEADYRSAARIVLATDYTLKLTDIPFHDVAEDIAAKALFIADLVGQMADRVYLEKLLYLYEELSEAGIMGYSSEENLLQKTIGFYEMVWKRIKNEAGYREEYLQAHFSKRWGIPHDLYAHAARKNITYLKHIMEINSNQHRKMLNRGGLVKQLLEKNGLQTT